MFRFLTAGESHGKGLTVIIEGIPAGLPLDEGYIASDMRRRQGGYGRGSRMKIEQDRAEILSGVRHGLTIGSPIALLIWNHDWENWKEIMSVTPLNEVVQTVSRPRPGHADLAGVTKYGLYDIRPILERSSARETAARVAAAAVARRFAEQFDIVIHSHTLAIGGKWANPAKSIDWHQVEKSSVRCADSEAEKVMISAIDEAMAAGDTLGGVFEVVATGVPVGLGSHVHWDRRLDGNIARVMMSIPSVKGVDIGDGFGSANLTGSQTHDIIEVADNASYPWRRTTNRAGGIEGGISNGESIVVRAAVKPIPTLGKPLKSVDLATKEVVQAHFERSDICIVPAAGVIGEGMLAIVLADAILEKFAGDNLKETLRNYHSYLNSIISKGSDA
jgi:chorismate synthase